MLRRIANFFQLDLALSLRDSMLVYSLISPLALAVILRLMVPSVQGTTFTMALHEELDPQVIAALADFGTVELFADRAAIAARVAANDNVPGLYYEPATGRYVLLLEGNEGAAAEEGFATLVAAATDPGSAGARADAAQFTITDLQQPPPPILEYGAVMLVLLSLFVGGVLIGFNIVDEKESEVIGAMAVSPLRIGEYIAARSLLALIIAYVAGIGCAFIVLGAAVPLGALAVAMFASLFVALPFGFIIGGLSQNQMTAFALVKLLMAVFLTLPFVSIFVPGHLQWLFYVFPNYWMFLTVRNALVGPGVVGGVLALALAAATGLAMTAALFPRLQRGLQLR